VLAADNTAEGRASKHPTYGRRDGKENLNRDAARLTKTYELERLNRHHTLSNKINYQKDPAKAFAMDDDSEREDLPCRKVLKTEGTSFNLLNAQPPPS
jgi:hypothetical protein